MSVLVVGGTGGFGRYLAQAPAAGLAAVESPSEQIRGLSAPLFWFDELETISWSTTTRVYAKRKRGPRSRRRVLYLKREVF